MTPELLEKSLLELTRQANELEGHRQVLARALADIERIADDCLDYDRSDLSGILYICRTGGVKLAMDPPA